MATITVFRCAHSGMYFPPDYIKEWGRKYGIGLGPTPVSECLDTQYLFPVCIPASGDMSKAMHPVGVTHAQLDAVEIEESDYNNNRAILQTEDPDMSRRSKIVREKQMVKSQRLAAMVGHKQQELL